MPSDTQTRDRDSEASDQRLSIPAEELRTGETVIWTSELNKEYRYRVEAIDSTWITFQTGLVVHRDRFERGAFEVLRAREHAHEREQVADSKISDQGDTATAD